jgi:hypothetical protein
MNFKREHFSSEEAFLRAKKVFDSLDELLSPELNSADCAKALAGIAVEAGELSISVLSQARSKHSDELYNSLKEVMGWYRNRTTPEMPHQMQERAINALWLADGSPATSEHE